MLAFVALIHALPIRGVYIQFTTRGEMQFVTQGESLFNKGEKKRDTQFRGRT
jgi:hypothetical protein